MSEEKTKLKLFREKSLEAIESPEVLNEYLRVTSPGIWLVMAAVIVLLAGGILWGIFGHIRTDVKIAVEVKDGESLCYVPYQVLDGVLTKGRGIVTVNGQDYFIDTNEEKQNWCRMEESDPVGLMRAGDMKAGDLMVCLPADTGLADGYYSGTAVVEDLHPISLLLQ